ncbi:hypothetical protein F5876DRAFT_73202 [Lentinula aff. lateritia]|uniref:Uncharacterized protein n=1 Tax=Lentinula aff. lateritia TaxID=2804960 RepID=A0ACC1UAX6_9AGAR|nr:hypothetical protein F5876DRAFT_73202 [Lentinula aff. lateritia]
MSRELQPWIQNYLIQIAETKGADLSSVEWSLKVKKAQVIEFITHGSRNKDEDTAIWARVSDKSHYIPVRFNAEAAAQYRRVNRTRLNEVKTALITLRKYRLFHSRVPSALKGHKLTHYSCLALECSELRLLGSIGEPTIGNPVGVETHQELSKYTIELSNPGGGANFLKLRAGERNQKRQDVQEKGEKNARYMGFNREIEIRHSPVSLVGPIAGPSSPRKNIGNLTSGSLHEIKSMPIAGLKIESIKTSRPTRPEPDRGKVYGRELTRRFVSIPETRGLNTKQRVHDYCKLFQDAGIDLQQLQQLESGRDNECLIPLNSPSTQLGKGVKRLGLSTSKFLSDAIQDCMGPEQMQNARETKYQRNKEGFCNKSAIKKVASNPPLVESNTKKVRSQKSKGSQESKFSQQLHTPGTSSYSSYSSSSPLLPSSPQSVLLTDWSSSDCGSPYARHVERKEKDAEKKNGPSSSPTPAQQQQRPSSARRAALSFSVLSVGDSAHKHSSTPLPPPPAQQPKVHPAPSTAPSSFIPDDNLVDMPSFDLNYTQSIKDECVSPIQVPKPTRVPRLPRIPPAFPPLGPGHLQSGDTSFVQQVIPESSQFRPAPPTPAQRRQPESNSNQTPQIPFSMSNPVGVESLILSSSTLPHATAKLTSAATAPSNLMNTKFRRKIPPPPPPPIRDGEGSPKVLAPNSDTSGTQSQSHLGSQSQSQSQEFRNSFSHPQPLGKASDPGHVSQTESDLQVLDVYTQKPLLKSDVAYEEFDPFNDDHDSLFSEQDDDITHHSSFEADSQHSNLAQNNFLQSSEDHRRNSKAKDDSIASASLKVHSRNSISDDESGVCNALLGIQTARKPDVSSTVSPTIEAVGSIDNVPSKNSPPTDFLNQFYSGIGTSQRSKEMLETLQTVSKPVAHDADAWSLPSFLRRKRTENTRAEKLRPVKTFHAEKLKARLFEVGSGVPVGETYQDFRHASFSSPSSFRAVVATAGNFPQPRSEKRFHADQGETGPSKKKQKIASANSPKREREQSAPLRKLDGFDPGFDDSLPGESFMSWEQLQIIALKIGRARVRQAQTG